MPDLLSNEKIEGSFESDKYPLTNKDRKKLQHEIKIYMEKYFKSKLGQAAENFKIFIWSDMLIFRAEKILSPPEKYIAQKLKGSQFVRKARMEVAKQHSLDNLSYLEKKLKAKCIRQSYDVDAEKDFFIHVMVFDKVFIDV
ncbi:putative protein DUF2294 [Desulfosarcina variabilis str. Montpellier]|uniref:DUF2294 domain-containing protein n=1 Tax=Desulfosarcina variabilis TaxID=2300 RepID=UPI003AFB7B47